MSDSTDVIQGTLDMLILKSLSLEPMHGFGVTQRIEQISRRYFASIPGSLLLAFQRMERQGLIVGEWRASENNRRAKYYRLTAKGRKRSRPKPRTGTVAPRPSRGCSTRKLRSRH